jgi:hypothetical protein
MPLPLNVSGFGEGDILSTREKRFVITTKPRQSGTCYISIDGTMTTFRSIAAKFHSAAGAQYFSRLLNITLIDPRDIHQEEFTEFELYYRLYGEPN